MKIFIVAMPGSGNLGDDLISGLLVEKLFKEYHAEHIGILCGENEITNYYKNHIGEISFFKRPRKRSLFEYYKRNKNINNFIRDCELIIVGGGGLLQDSHSPFTIFNYLKYIIKYNKNVLILGMGVGPIRFSFNKWYIKKILNNDYIIQVRDNESKDYLKSIGVETNILVDYDVIEGSETNEYLKNLESLSNPENNMQNVLGCNIRNWPDIELKQLIPFIDGVVKKYSIDIIKFFVFENGINNSSEKDFTLLIVERLKSLIKTRLDIYIYNETEHTTFFKNFYSANLAIASRFHANILWQSKGVKTLPIVYSPKVKSLYSKHGIKAYEFKELIKMDNYPFVLLPSITNQYNLPKTYNQEINNKTYFKIINSLVTVFSFIYETWKSVKIRLKR